MAAGEPELQLFTLPPPPPPPTEFCRTISWQLSQVQDYGDTREKERLERKKQRKRERREQNSESAEQQSEWTRRQQQSKEEDAGSDGGKVVPGNEGEELYYSPHEYPLTSSDSEPESPLMTHDTSHDTLLYSSKLGKSKKQKEKRTEIAHRAVMEFFQPLCDMVEEKICIDLEDKELASKTAVPSLVEICLRSLQKISLTESEENLPYLLTSLLRQNREMSNIVSGHVRWLERFLGTSELYLAFRVAEKVKKEEEKKKEKEVDPPQAYLIQDVWNLENRVISFDESCGYGHHIPLPAPTHYDSCRQYWHEYYAFKRYALAVYHCCLHYINYMYPRMVHEPTLNQPRTEQPSQPSSPSPPSSSSVIKSNIRRVNLWLTTRYPHFMKLTQEASCLWPAYVHWARGNLKLATDDFITATKLLENCYDQAITLNEMARMFVHFGERSNAVRFYRKSADINLSHTRDYNVKIDSQLVPLCSLALQASVWSTGVQDQYSALQSACAWEAVLTAARSGIPTNVWFLHAAAAESLLFTHAGYPVGSSESSAQRRDSQVEQWLNDCEKMLVREKNAFPVLDYYLSLIYAMKGNELQSKRTFEAYINDFASFMELDNDVFPGYQYSSWLAPADLRKSPWQHLINLLKAEKWSHAAILPLKWRVQLLHPLHPYPKFIVLVGLNYIADHAPSTNLGLRLTPDGRYLTADIHMDMPPMRCVLMDPYNGSLCFSRATSLQHYTYSNGSETEDGESSLPWPIRLYESSKCTVELTMAQTQVAYENDLKESNYLAVLHWYGSDGRVLKLDLRTLIRQEMKKAMLEEAKSLYSNEEELKTVESHIDELVERGLELDIKNVKLEKKPRKGSLDNTCGVGETLCPEFALKLVSHIMIGSATILLSFHLTDAISFTCNTFPKSEVLVFINCRDGTSFLHPSIHCCPRSFQYVFPHSKVAAPYPFYHMSHIKYVITVEVYPCSTKEHDLIYFLVFDEFGNEICRHLIFEGHRRLGLASLSGDCVIGSCVVNVDERTHVVTSRDVVCREDQSSDHHTSAVVNQATDILTVPGLLLVVCNGGLYLLHPATLERVTVEGLRESDTASPSQDGILYPQFPTHGVADVSILKVVDVICREQEKETIEEKPKEILAGKKDPKEDEAEEENTSTAAEDVHSPILNDNVDFGSCRVVLSVNDRLLVLRCMERTEKVVVLLDVDLPGKPTEVHLMDSYGYLVSCSQFPDMYSDDLYWLSSNGRLLGMLPCLKGGNHSFYSTVLPSRPTNSSSPAEATSNEEDVATGDDSGGLHVYFDDGRGGICCLRLKDVLQQH